MFTLQVETLSLITMHAGKENLLRSKAQQRNKTESVASL